MDCRTSLTKRLTDFAQQKQPFRRNAWRISQGKDRQELVVDGVWPMDDKQPEIAANSSGSFYWRCLLRNRLGQNARCCSMQQQRADEQIHRCEWIPRFRFAAAGWNASSFHLRKTPHTYVPASGPQDRGRHFLHLYDSLDLFMKRHARQSGPSCLFCAEQPFDVRIHVVHSFHFNLFPGHLPDRNCSWSGIRPISVSCPERGAQI